MGKHHYHVLAGDHGYMPDVNEVTTSRRHAETIAVDLVREARDAGDRYVGSARTGGYECVSLNEVGNTAHSGWEYIEIQECYEQDCVTD